jgi:hypothetical protein
MDGAIVYRMPRIMRYCFEEQIDLRKNKLIRKLPATPNFYEEERYANETRFYLNLPLKEDSPCIRKVEGNLVIDSTPAKLTNQNSVSFAYYDVPKLVEGFLKVYGGKNRDGAYLRILQAINIYHEDLDKGIIKQ